MAQRVYSVLQINTYIKNMFSQDYVLNHIYVKGEVSNCKYHSSGHLYFTLKDGETESQIHQEATSKSGGFSAIACVMFAGNRTKLPFVLKDGQHVIVEGSVNVYERDGKYQIYVADITLDGIGELYLQFEKNKQELQEMGMFDPMYKKPIPRYGQRIGVVTASTGAAIQDIIQISFRRNPHVQIILYPALVQGDGAVESIIQGIRMLDSLHLDCLIVGRGGGSIEDLWAFNHVEVAYAIFQAQTPVISAVGHETDVTIADYVADLRAPTPSAAAELAVFSYVDAMNTLVHMAKRLQDQWDTTLKHVRQRLRLFEMQLHTKKPQSQVMTLKQRLQKNDSKLQQQMQNFIVAKRYDMEKTQGNLEAGMHSALLKYKHKLALYAEKLDAYSPMKRLSGGYTYVQTASGQQLQSITQLCRQDVVTLYLRDGLATAQIMEIREDIRYDH